MLILTRKLGESVMIEDTIRITVLEVRGSQVKLGIHAPISVRVNREEVLERQRAEAGLPPLDLPPAETQMRDRANGQRPEPRTDPRDHAPRGGQRRSGGEPREERHPGDYPARGRELPGERDRERGRGGRGPGQGPGPGGPGAFSRGSRPERDPGREARPRGEEERWDAPRWESTRSEPRRDEPRRDEPRRDEPRRDEPRRDDPRRGDARRPEHRTDPRSNEPRRDAESRDDARRDPWRRDNPADQNRDYGRRFKRPPAAERRPSNPLLGPSEPPESSEEPGTIRRYREPSAMQAFRPRRPPVGPNPEAGADDPSQANGRLPGSPDPASERPPHDESDTPPKAQGGSGDFEAA